MRRIILYVLGLLWLGGFLVGMKTLAAYDNTPGVPAAPPASWPAGTRFRRDSGKPTLMLFVHPRCPCSRASLSELEELMAQARGRLAVYVLFYRPSKYPRGWEQTDLWFHAAAIPGVTALPDPDGESAQAFGAATSGQAIFYDSAGRERFRGGITGARGQSGDNAGSRAILALVKGERADAPITPVFGCSLLGQAGENGRK